MITTRSIAGLLKTTLLYCGVPAYTTERTRSMQYVIGSILLMTYNMPCELPIGMMAPLKNICGMVIKETAIFAVLLLLIVPIMIVASEPADRHMRGANKIISSSWFMLNAMPINSPTIMVPNIPTIAPKEEPSILPMMML